MPRSSDFTADAVVPAGRSAPQVARVSVETLRDLRRALDGGTEPHEIEELRADLDHLIAAAEESAWPL